MVRQAWTARTEESDHHKGFAIKTWIDQGDERRISLLMVVIQIIIGYLIFYTLITSLAVINLSLKSHKVIFYDYHCGTDLIGTFKIILLDI